MSENKIGVALVHEICPICGKSMNEQILMNSVLNKKYAVVGILFLLLLLRMMNGSKLVEMVLLKINAKVLYLKTPMVLFMI